MQRRIAIIVLLASFMLAAPVCNEPPTVLESSSATREPAIGPGDPLYDRVEGVGFENACSIDADCHLAGCSTEVCSAEKDVMTTCEAIAWPPADASCGCVDGRCIWYVP